MIGLRCPLCKNRYSCEKMGMIPFENCGMFVIDDTAKRHKTNADRLRNMTDEELAAWLTALEIKAYSRLGYSGSEKRFKAQYIEWLKSPAEEDE